MNHLPGLYESMSPRRIDMKPEFSRSTGAGPPWCPSLTLFHSMVKPIKTDQLVRGVILCEKGWCPKPGGDGQSPKQVVGCGCNTSVEITSGFRHPKFSSDVPSIDL